MAGSAKLQLILDLNNRLKGGLNSAKDQVTKSCGSMQDKLDRLQAKHTKVFNAMGASVPGFGSAIGMLANPYMIAGAAITAVGASVYKATMKAAEWQEQMAQINVTAELSKTKLKDLSNELLDIGARSAVDLDQVPQAFNRIISAGLSVEESMKTLEPTLRAAKSTATDIETVASAATSVIMSSGREVNDVFDILTQTLKDGSAEFKDIAQYLPKIIPMARNVGFSLEETAGAYASLTGKLGARASTTALEGVFRSLSNTSTLQKFEKMGISVFNKDGSVRELTEIIKETNTKFEGLSDKAKTIKFDQLGLDQMGALGISTLMQGFEELEKSINNMENAQGALNKAYEDSLTPLDQWRQIQNEIRVSAIKLGEKFLPFMNEVGTKIKEFIEKMKKLYNENENLRKLLHALKVIALDVLGGLLNLIFELVELVAKLAGKVADLFSMFGIEVTNVNNGLYETKGIITQIFDLISDLLNLDLKKFFNDLLAFNLSGRVVETPEMQNPNLQYNQYTKQWVDPVKLMEEGYKQRLEEFKRKKASAAAATPTTTTTTTPTKTTNEDGKTIKSGSQTKNVSITFRNFVENFKSENKELANMNKDELEKWLEGVFIRMIQSAERII